MCSGKQRHTPWPRPQSPPRTSCHGPPERPPGRPCLLRTTCQRSLAAASAGECVACTPASGSAGSFWPAQLTGHKQCACLGRAWACDDGEQGGQAGAPVRQGRVIKKSEAKLGTPWLIEHLGRTRACTRAHTHLHMPIRRSTSLLPRLRQYPPPTKRRAAPVASQHHEAEGWLCKKHVKLTSAC